MPRDKEHRLFSVEDNCTPPKRVGSISRSILTALFLSAAGRVSSVVSPHSSSYRLYSIQIKFTLRRLGERSGLVIHPPIHSSRIGPL